MNSKELSNKLLEIQNKKYDYSKENKELSEELEVVSENLLKLRSIAELRSTKVTNFIKNENIMSLNSLIFAMLLGQTQNIGIILITIFGINIVGSLASFKINKRKITKVKLPSLAEYKELGDSIDRKIDDNISKINELSKLENEVKEQIIEFLNNNDDTINTKYHEIPEQENTKVYVKKR